MKECVVQHDVDPPLDRFRCRGDSTSAMNCCCSNARRRDTPARRWAFATRVPGMRARAVPQVEVERRVFEGFFMCVRSDRWPKWACRRAPATRRGTARTLAGSVRYFESNYTPIATLPNLPRTPSRWHILDVSLRFPEPCSHFGFQPSQSTSSEGS